MMQEYYDRTVNLIGEDGLERLQKSSVAIFGVGGVGSFAAEAIARGGVGDITVIDADVAAKSNINRQLLVTVNNIGEPKVKIMRERIKNIAPFAKVTGICGFYPNVEINLRDFDFIIDAIDDVAAKCELILNASKLNVPVISSMGAGNRLFPELFEITDIYKTNTDPLARVMRKKLKILGIKSLPVVCSREIPKKTKDSGKIGSVSFAPGAAGLIMAGYVIRELLGIKNNKSEAKTRAEGVRSC